MQLTTKYEIDQHVWAVMGMRGRKWIVCPTCNGAKRIIIGDESFKCPKCYGNGGHNEDLGCSHYFIHAHGYIGKISVEHQVDLDTHAVVEHEVRYMLSSTGIGSGTCWPEDHLFASELEAQQWCDKKNAEELENRGGLT